jgi:hypothetical protein
MKKCWAASLGDCSDKISGEHIVSAGLFSGGKILVKGFPWCQNEPKEIGLASLVKNILCTKHNSELSIADEAGVQAFDTFRESIRLQRVRLAMKPMQWRVSRFKLDGWQLERWFLKTLINVATKGPFPIGRESNSPGEPSLELVEIAFGLARFQARAGLYLLPQAGEKFMSEDRVAIIPFLNSEKKYLVGATFYFRGHPFVLYLGNEGLNDQIDFLDKDGKSLRRSNPIHHIRKIRFLNRKRLSHVVEIRW